MAGSCAGCHRANFEGYAPMSFELGIGFWALALLLAIAVLAIALPFLLPKRTRPRAARAVTNALILIVLSMAGPPLGDSIRMHGIERIVERGAPIVAAIRSFEDEHRAPPAQLADLVPTYLTELPETGYGDCPEYSYFAEPEKNPGYFSLYAICAGVNVVYYSHGVYGDYQYRKGDWAYSEISD